jgi:hypothetical protein
VEFLVRFAMCAFFPRVDDLPGLDELGVDEKIARLRRDSTRLFWTGVVGAAIFFQLSPILTVHRPWPAILLTEEQLDRHAHLLATSQSYLVRQIVMLLKLMGGIFWGESPEIRGYLQLPPYTADPGTRRLEPHVARPASGPRAPVPQLVTLGRREEARGRGTGHDGAASGPKPRAAFGGAHSDAAQKEVA